MPNGRFEQKPGIKPEEIKEEPKTKAEMKKEWREHFGPLAEAEEEKEKSERKEARVRAKEWKEYFGPLTEMWTPAMRKEAKRLAEEKKSVETARIPVEGMQTEAILKEVGIQKPAESFEEVQKRLAEKLEETREAKVRAGERFTLVDKNETTRDFYLGELGWVAKYKGFLRPKTELFNEEGKIITDEKGKPMEFKRYLQLKRKGGEMPIAYFLQERLKEKLGKPEKEKTEEEKWEAGFQKAVKEAKQEQEKREETISSLADVKKVGRERLEKVMGGLSYVAALDKIGVLGLREGKKLAIEGGKDFVSIGLSPAMAVEEVGREVAGRLQVWRAVMEKITTEGKIKTLEEIAPEKRPEYYNRLLETLRETSGVRTEKMISGYDKIFKKGKILRFLEAWGGRVGRAMGETLEPHAH